jgi:hypothetical protein
MDTEPKPKKRPYRAQVRRKGVFRDIGLFETAEQAYKAARTRVSTTAAASARVEGPEGITTPPRGLFSQLQFFRSGKERGVIIERPEKRIKSRGELAEITFRGQQALRAKRSNKSIFGF